MKHNILFILIFLFLIFLSGCGSSSEVGTSNGSDEVEEIKLRAATGITSEHPQYQGLLKFKELVEEQTGGAIIVETYHSGQLGDDRSMMEALQLGSLEVTVPSTGPIANFVPEFAVLEFPFLFPNLDVAREVLQGEVGQKLLKKLETQNIVGLAFWEDGFRNVTNSRREIETLEDLKGLSLRTMENELHIAAFRALGVNPTPMAFTELFTSMQQGTVDGQENPLGTIYHEKFDEVQSYLSNTEHINNNQVFLIGKEFFDQLSTEQQEIVQKAALEAGDYQAQLTREKTEYYLEELQKRGMIYTEITEEERARMREAVQPVITEYSERIGEDLVQEVYGAIEKAAGI